MAIVEMLTYTVKPGRFDEVIALARDSKGMYERTDTGLTGMRLLRAGIAGADSGHIILLIEYTDLPGWAASIEAEQSDLDVQEMRKKAYGPAAAVTLVSRVLLTDIPL